MGQAIKDGLGSTAGKRIVLFAGSSTDKNAELIFNGAWNKLQTAGLTVVDNKTAFNQVAVNDWEPANAKTRMDGITWANVDAVLTPNDNIARYIINNYPAVSGKIITGADAQFDSALYIKAGKQYMTVFKDTRILAGCAVDLADQILQKQPINLEKATGELAEMGNTSAGYIPTYILDPQVIKKGDLGVLIGTRFYSGYPGADIEKLK